MKALVVYESMFGNSRQVARAIASGLSEYAEVQLVPVADAPQAPDQDLDLVVAGGPTHAFSLSRPKTREEAVRRGAVDAQTEFGLREWLKGLPDGHGARLVTFDTKVRRAPGSAAHRAAREAAAHGYVAPVRWMSFFVHDYAGPLTYGELDRAREWGRSLGVLLTRAANREASRVANRTANGSPTI